MIPTTTILGALAAATLAASPAVAMAAPTHGLGLLPVPKPVAARYSRAGLCYRCDLITQRIMAAEPLSGVIAARALPESLWHGVGATVARLHRAGVDHADLNAHNLLLDVRGQISVIDFDRGRLRAPGAWASRNLQRLRRSLEKVSRGLPADRYSPEIWQWFLAGYGAHLQAR